MIDLDTVTKGEQVVIPQKNLSKILLPDRAIPKNEIPKVAQSLSETLQEFTDSLTAFVMLKQANEIVKSALEQTQDSAMMKFEGKEMVVFGATVKTRPVVEYEYNDGTLQDMEANLETLKKQIDDRKKMLRSLTEEVANTGTGEILIPAKKIRDGLTLTVSFKEVQS
jgi:hypothetical protein